MNTDSDISLGGLFKACFISLLWAALSLTVTLHFQWEAPQLAKAFYILTAYSLLCVLIHFTLWQVIERFSKPKTIEFNIFDPFESFASLKLSHAPFEVFVSAIIMLAAFCALVLTSMLKILAERTNGWETPPNMNGLKWFFDITAENWWLALLIVAFSIWKFITEYRATKARPVDLYKFKTRSNVKLTFAATGYGLLMFVISAFFNSHDQRYLYTLLIILFFLPWDAIFEIIMKTHDDYWKLD